MKTIESCLMMMNSEKIIAKQSSRNFSFLLSNSQKLFFFVLNQTCWLTMTETGREIFAVATFLLLLLRKVFHNAVVLWHRSILSWLCGLWSTISNGIEVKIVWHTFASDFDYFTRTVFESLKGKHIFIEKQRQEVPSCLTWVDVRFRPGFQ